MKRDLLIAKIALGVVCIVWGTTYLAIRIGIDDSPPFFFVMTRQLLAGALLVGFVCIVKKIPLPTKEQLFRQAIGGFFMLTIPNGSLAWSELFVPSGVAAVICSLMPMTVILTNLAINQEEKPTLPIFLGVFTGLLGILLMFSEDLGAFSNAQYAWGIVIIFIGMISWSSGSVWVKRYNTNENAFLNAGLQMFFGGVWLLPFSLMFDDLSVIHWSANTTYALIYLVLIGSLLAYSCFTYALRKFPVTVVSLYAYVNPLVAIFLGWLILDEKLNFRILAATVMTIGGIYIVNRGYYLRNLWKAQFSKS